MIAAILLALPAVVSYVARCSRSRRTRRSRISTVEWLRDNGARGLVNQVENVYYSLNAPATGGPALRALPKQPGAVRLQPTALVAAYG